MATFKVLPDPRYKRKNGTHRYCLRAIVEGKVQYIPINYGLTAEQHNKVCKQKSMSRDCIDIRENFNNLEIKAERIYNSMRRYDPKRFKELFKANWETNDISDMNLPQTLELSALTNYYLDKANIKHSTKIHFKSSMSVIEQYSPGIYLDDIDSKFLMMFEIEMLEKDKSISTVSSYLRNLRTLINYYKDQIKILPSDYVYPFGKAGHSIKNTRKKKKVLSEKEILKVIELEKFDSPKQEYARNIWLVLYYGSGINPIDLLKLKWSKIDDNIASILRTKTETTRKYNIQEILIPFTEDFKYYLDKVSDPTSFFVLGKLKEDYTQTSLLNRKNRFRGEINPELRKIASRLNLSAPLLMSTARDCYACTLKRNGVSLVDISECLGHSDIKTTMNYLDSLSIDESFAVNNNLVKSKKRKSS